MRRGKALGVTGTPCTGKKSIAPRLASILGRKLIDINSVAERASSTKGHARPSAELLVDVATLRMEVLRNDLSDAVVSGHMLPDVLGKRELEFAAVLRCEPLELKKRLEARGYAHKKVVDNVEAELIGVVLDDSLRAFGKVKVHEYDTTRAWPFAVAELIASDFRSGAPQRRPWIDWTLSYDSSAKLRLLDLSPAESTGPAST